MVAGDFKNKLSSANQSCMLSVPTVIKGEEYSFRSLADGEILETVMLFRRGTFVGVLAAA